MSVVPKAIPETLECTCGERVFVLETAYGFRAICPPCNIRWTWIIGENRWVPEVR